MNVRPIDRPSPQQIWPSLQKRKRQEEELEVTDEDVEVLVGRDRGTDHGRCFGDSFREGDVKIYFLGVPNLSFFYVLAANRNWPRTWSAVPVP